MADAEIREFDAIRIERTATGRGARIVIGAYPADDVHGHSRAQQALHVGYDNRTRVLQRDQLKMQIAPALAEARAWIEKRLKSTPLPERLARPLLGDAPPLL